MPTKFQLIIELYDQTVQSVTGSYQSWTGFLRAACYNYKCPFDEQLLIYAQRPDATAVLEMERWNRQFGRWVNRGAKSIAVFGDDGQNCLKLYFDVSDTHASRFARPLPIWTMHPAFEPEVIETLEATFGNLAEKENLADAVRSACHNAVADNITDYLQDLRDCREDSLLEELDDLNLEVFYRDALEVSVAYMLMTRLGLRADDYFSPDEFAHVYEFNTPPTINALGIATSDIAEMGLREISRTVMQAQRDQFFANRTRIGYDGRTEQHETPHERSEQHGGHLQDAERLSGAEPADAADAGGASGQVRGAAERISDEAPQGALHQPQDQRQADGASGGDRADRAEDGGADRGADGENRGRDGGAEGDRSPALDGSDEQSPAQRGGAGAQRPDLRLTTEEPTEAGSDELPASAVIDAAQPTIKELFEQYKQTVAAALVKDTAFVNACRNSDRENAIMEGADAIRRIVNESGNLQLAKLYFDMPAFHNRLHQELLEETYPKLVNAADHSPFKPYQVAAYHHFENGFDDKLDYQTLEEAEAAAQGYVAGTMEEDGFAYDGAAVYDAETRQCLRVYGDYPDEKAQEQAAAFALEHDTAQQNTAVLPAFLDMHLIEANLLDDGGRKHKRQEIFEYFQAHKNLAERTEFLKNSYNDIWVEVLTDGVRTGYHAEKDGLLMWEGSYLSRTLESVFSWPVITEMTEGLIERGEYKIKLGLQNAPIVAEQLALFDMGGDAPVYEAPADAPSGILAPARTVPQEVIDLALCTGGNEPNSAERIAVFYMRERPEQENEEFLRREFGTENGRGIEYEGRKYAVWFMEDGVHLAQGDSVRTGYSKTMVTWEQTSARILELLEAGTYLSASELAQAPDKVLHEAMDALLMTARDLSEEGRKQGLFPQTLTIHDQRKGYPELDEDMVAFAKTEGGLQILAQEYHTFLDAYAQDRDIITTMCAALRTRYAGRMIYPSSPRRARASITPSGRRIRAASPPCAASSAPTLTPSSPPPPPPPPHQAYTYDTFLMLLRKNGYEVRRSPNRKYTTVKPPGAKRAIRLDSLGEGYTEADILLRLSRQRHSGMTPPIIAHTVKRYRMKGKLSTVRKKKITGFHALYLRYLYLLRGGRRKKLPPKLPFSVKREVIHLERYEQQFKYLLSSGITTEAELEQRIRVLEWDIRLLEEQRKPLYQERRNTSDEEAQAKYSAEIQQQTAALREKRGELRLCRRIQSDIPRVSQQCQQAQAERQENLKNKEEHEHEYQR